MDERPATKGDIDELKKDLKESLLGLSAKVDLLQRMHVVEAKMNATQQIEIENLQAEIKSIKTKAWGLITVVLGLIIKSLAELLHIGGLPK